MNQAQLATKALYMQRDYSNKEIAELLNVRLEDLTTAIENHKAGRKEELNKAAKPEKKKAKRRKKKTS